MMDARIANVRNEQVAWSMGGAAAGAVLGHIVGDLIGYLAADGPVDAAAKASVLQEPFRGWDNFTAEQWEAFDELMQARSRQSEWRRYVGAFGGALLAGIGAGAMAPTRLQWRVGLAAGILGGIGYAVPYATPLWGPGLAALGAYLGTYGDHR